MIWRSQERTLPDQLVYHENQISNKNIFSGEPGKENLSMDLKFYFVFLLLNTKLVTTVGRQTIEVSGLCSSQAEGPL